MALYKLILNSRDVFRTTDDAVIHADNNNPEWVIYQQWLEEGNTPDPVDIELSRFFYLEKLLKKRNTIIQSGIIVDTRAYFTDDASINTMLQAITMHGLDIGTVFPRNWILADGTTALLTYDDMKAVAVAIAAKKDACFAHYMALADQIRASSDPESVDIESGWPQ